MDRLPFDDALRTRRPYRDAWPADDALRYVEGRGGMEFDPEIVRQFAAMVRQWETGLTVLPDERTPITPPPVPATGDLSSPQG